MRRAENINTSKRLLKVAGGLDAEGELSEIIGRGKCDLEYRDISSGGLRPLHTAVKNGRQQNAIKLILAGANVNAKDMDGWAPLHFACTEGHLEIVDILLQSNADINLTNKEGNTPLFYAASRGHMDIVVKLLENGNINTNYNNKNGERACDLAEQYGQKEISDLLKEHTEQKTRKLRKNIKLVALLGSGLTTNRMRRSPTAGLSPRERERRGSTGNHDLVMESRNTPTSTRRTFTEPVAEISPFSSPLPSPFASPHNSEAPSGTATPPDARSQQESRCVSPVGGRYAASSSTMRFGSSPLAPIKSEQCSYEDYTGEEKKSSVLERRRKQQQEQLMANLSVVLPQDGSFGSSNMDDTVPTTPWSGRSDVTNRTRDSSFDVDIKSAGEDGISQRLEAWNTRQDSRKLPSKEPLAIFGMDDEFLGDKQATTIEDYQARLQRLEKNLRQEKEDALEEKEQEISMWRMLYEKEKNRADALQLEKDKISDKLKGLLSDI